MNTYEKWKLDTYENWKMTNMSKIYGSPSSSL